MSDITAPMDEGLAEAEALKVFEREIGATGVETQRAMAGDQLFLKFVVGREAPIYMHALRESQKALSPTNPFRGTLGLVPRKSERFPESLEATALLTLLTRSTRAVAQDTIERGFSVPYVPFQNREDHQLAQPASHVVVGRRGVGKSTLIRRAVEILRATAAIVAVLDVQAYSNLSGDHLAREVLYDSVRALIEDASRASALSGSVIDTHELKATAAELAAERISPSDAVPRIKRNLQSITKATANSVFVFLDDFHLLERVLHVERQP